MASPAQVFSCVDAQAILKSPINTSPSKTHWSFSKDSRFKRPKYYCDSFYKIPELSENKNRKAGFGYGKKTDLDYGKHPHNQTPPPDHYQIESVFQNNEKKDKGFTPLYSREDVAPTSYIDLELAKLPGPGRYQQHRYNESPKWSMRPRVSSEIFPKTSALIVPAPCTYDNTQAIGKNITGKYHLARYPSSKVKAFNPPRSKRFKKSQTDTPGPGIYRPQNELSSEGKYVLSRNVSAGKRTFMSGPRQSFIDSTVKRCSTPGPGSYRAPSDFGHYDSKHERWARLSKSQMLAGRDKISSSGQTNFTDR